MPRTWPLLLLAAFLSACSSPPETVQTHLDRGRGFLAAGDTAAAIAAFRLALDRDSLNVVSLAELGRIYAHQGKANAADIYLRRALDLTYQRGLRALQAGDTVAATAAFEHTLEIYPPHPLALIRLGELCLATGREEKALEYFTSATQANPDYPEGFIKLGQLYARRQRPREAQLAFERAIELNINAIDAYLGLGELQRRQENWKAAAEQFAKALLIDPRSPAAREALEQLQRHL